MKGMLLRLFLNFHISSAEKKMFAYTVDWVISCVSLASLEYTQNIVVLEWLMLNQSVMITLIVFSERMRINYVKISINKFCFTFQPEILPLIKILSNKF